MSDRVEQVLEELDPTPAHEANWPVSRRQTLRALASVGALAAVPSASAQSAGTVIADEATFSNYGSVSTASGYDLTIEGDTFAFDGDDTIGLEDGGTGTEVVTPGGVEASQVVGPDGQTLWTPGIPDSAEQYLIDEGSGTVFNEAVDGSPTATLNGGSWVSDSNLTGGFGYDFESGNNYAEIASNFGFVSPNDSFSAAFTVDFVDLSERQTVWGQSNGTYAVTVGTSNPGDSVSGRLGMSVFDGSSFVDRQMEKTLATTDRLRLGVRFNSDSNTIDLFFNGAVAEDEIDSNPAATNTANGNNLGIWSDPSTNSDGTFPYADMILDNPIWWDQALSDEVFTADYQEQPWS